MAGYRAKPPSPRLAPDHPLAGAVSYLYAFPGDPGGVQGYRPTLTAGRPSFAPGRYGSELACASGSDYLLLDGPCVATAYPYTLLFLGAPEAVANRVIAGESAANSNNPAVIFRYNGDNTGVVSCFIRGSTGVVVEPAVAGTWADTLVAVTGWSSTDHRLYAGPLTGTSSVDAGAIATDTLCINRWQRLAFIAGGALRASLFAGLRCALTRPQYDALAADPFALVRPAAPRPYLFLPASPPPPGDVALVASASAAGPDGGTTAALDTTGATLLTVKVSQLAGTGTPAVSDSYGNTWTPLTEYAAGSASVRWHYAANPTVGAGHTFTVAGVNTFSAFDALAFSGVDAASPFLGESGATGTGSSLQPGAVTPGADGALVLAGLCLSAAVSAGPSVDSGFTLDRATAYSSGNNVGGAAAYLVQSAAAAVNPTWSWSGSVGAAAAMAAFRPATGGATSYTLSAGAGGFALAGQPAAIRADRKLPAVAGAFAATGSAATPRVARKLAAGAGTFALTGSGATLTASGAGSKTLTAAAGQFALAGSSASLRVARLLPAQAGGFALAGSPAALRAGRVLPAAAGLFTNTGSAAGLRAARVLPASAGAFALTGSPASFGAGTAGKGLVCATAGLRPTIRATAGLRPTVNATAGLREC